MHSRIQPLYSSEPYGNQKKSYGKNISVRRSSLDGHGTQQEGRQMATVIFLDLGEPRGAARGRIAEARNLGGHRIRTLRRRVLARPALLRALVARRPLFTALARLALLRMLVTRLPLVFARLAIMRAR